MSANDDPPGPTHHDPSAPVDVEEEQPVTTCWDELIYTLFALSVALLAILIGLYIAKLQLDKDEPPML